MEKNKAPNTNNRIDKQMRAQKHSTYNTTNKNKSTHRGKPEALLQGNTTSQGDEVQILLLGAREQVTPRPQAAHWLTDYGGPPAAKTLGASAQKMGCLPPGWLQRVVVGMAVPATHLRVACTPACAPSPAELALPL